MGNLIFASGQLPINHKIGKMIEGDIETQAKMALNNFKAVSEHYSISMENIVKNTIFLKDMDNFARVNKFYA
ncbi:2-iminobutanoate/2-iminopropanoate deaminase [subsurface metagenome]